VCWILPQTQGWGRLWGTLFIGTVFAQAVQVLTLRLGFNLTTDLPPATASGLIQPLLGIAVLALTLKIPGLMRGNFVAALLGTARVPWWLAARGLWQLARRHRAEQRPRSAEVLLDPLALLSTACR
jgi:hypothetical protein